MKKRILTLTLLALSIIFVLLLCSCKGNEDETDIKRPPYTDTFVPCVHKWETKSQILPSCSRDGETVMECVFCNKTKTVTSPKTECNYLVRWEWYNEKTSVSAYFTCPDNKAHNYTTNGTITSRVNGDLISKSTCTTQGKRAHRATVTYKGKVYSTELITYIPKSAHNYVSVTESLGSYCFAGTKTYQKCSHCGTLKWGSERTEYNHTEVKSLERYNLADYGYCGGYAEIRGCECGTTRYLNVYSTCAELKLSDISITEGDGGEIISRDVKLCSACGLSLITESTEIYNGKEYVLLCESTELSLDEETKLTNYRASSDVHESLLPNHELKVSTEGFLQSCKGGYFVVLECSDCSYKKKFHTRGHYLVNETVSLDEFGVCGIEITAQRCHCGYVGDIELENKLCTLSEISPFEHFGEILSASPNEKAYKCTECGVSYYLGSINEYDTEFNNVSYEICSVKINGEEIFKLESSIHKYVSFSDDNWILSDEERQEIEDYFNSLKNNE